MNYVRVPNATSNSSHSFTSFSSIFSLFPFFFNLANASFLSCRFEVRGSKVRFIFLCAYRCYFQGVGRVVVGLYVFLKSSDGKLCFACMWASHVACWLTETGAFISRNNKQQITSVARFASRNIIYQHIQTYLVQAGLVALHIFWILIKSCEIVRVTYHILYESHIICTFYQH